MRILSDVSQATIYPSIILRQVRRTRCGFPEQIIESWTLTGFDCSHVTYPSQDAALADLHSFAADYGCLVALMRNEDGEVVQSLGSVCEPSHEYRRVVEAELALEQLG